MTSDFDPDLRTLESEYQILTELHRSADTRTYLARHLGLNRDVTITVIRSADPDILKSFDADTSRLASLRQTNVVHTIEGRYLSANEYAVVHARARGATLEQTVTTMGMALPVAASALQQVHAALTWAREQTIAHRYVSPDELMFQQGSGRVLIAFTPAPNVLAGVARATADGARVPDACADARTIGELAFMMLGGKRVDGDGAQSLAKLRPDLPPALVVQTEALLRCDVNGVVPNVDAYIEQFRPVAAAVPVSRISAEHEVPVPVAARADTVVVTHKRGMSFGARFATTVAVLVVLGVAAMLYVSRRGTQQNEAAGRIVPDTAVSSDTSDIAQRARQSDSLLAAQAPQPVIVAPPVNATPMPQPMPSTMQPPMKSQPTTTPPPQDIQAIPTPDARRRALSRPTEPVVPDTSIAPPQTLPTPPTSPITRPTPVVPPSAATPPVTSSVIPPVTPPLTPPVTPPVDSIRSGDVCDSPAPADQRHCLSNVIDRKDAAVNELYQRVVRALRRQANVQPQDADPPSVDALSSEQRAWTEDRETLCQTVGSGALFARDRAACYSDRTDRRLRVLQAKLDAIPPG